MVPTTIIGQHLEHRQQMCQMCQMSNIWHIWYTKHKKQSFIRCVKYVKFLQYAIVPLHFNTLRTQMAFVLYCFYSSFSLIPLWATPSLLLRIVLSLLPLCLIALSLVKDRFWCGYILAWAPAWVRWWCGSWVWRHGGSWRGGSGWGGSRTHDRGKWVLMGGFRWGLGWFPSPGFFFFFFFTLSSLFDLFGCVWCGFCF